jgi:hypothetical protein
MTQSHPMDNLLNSLLSDPVLGKDLSAADKATVKTMVGELMGLASPTTQPNRDEATETGPDHDAAIADLDALLSELGIDPDELPDPPVSIDDLLKEQSDTTLIDALSDHVDSASGVVEVLSTRPRKGQMLEEVRRVELQLIALAIGVADLREALEQQAKGRVDRPWKARLKALLLHEFRFINRWVR